MKNRLKLIFLTALSMILAATAASAQRKFSGKIVDVIDGKTVVIEMRADARLTAELQYIEVPEPEQELHATVKNHLRQMVIGKDAELLVKGFSKTKTVGQLTVRGVDVSQQMLRDGAAWHVAIDKSGQDAGEWKLYQDNETQAKSERIGVWSIEKLKPAWEFRAEKEAAQKEKEEAEWATYKSSSGGRNRRWTVEEQLRANQQMEMWADVTDSMAAANQVFTGIKGAGSTELVTAYFPAASIGVIATPPTGFLTLQSSSGERQRVDCRSVYVYLGDVSKPRERLYTLGFVSESRDWQFLKSNDLTIVADGQKIIVGIKPLRRFSRQIDYAVQELVIYGISRNSLAKIASAKKVDVKLGRFSGEIHENARNFFKRLLAVAG